MHDTESQTIIRTRIDTDHTERSPVITMIGLPESEDHICNRLSKFATDLAHKLYPILAKWSLEKMGGMGWEKIDQDDYFGVMKFGFGKDTVSISPTDFIQDKVSNSINFTARKLCHIATYCSAKAIERTFPELEIFWLTTSVNMMENQKGPGIPHHLLVIKPKEIDYTMFLDMTYGQVKHGEGVLFAPFKIIAKYYPDIIDTQLKPLADATQLYEAGLADDGDSLSVITEIDAQLL